MNSITIDAGWILIAENKLLRNGRIIIEDGRIIEIGSQATLSHLPRDTVRYSFIHGLVLPAAINAHTHLPETLIRGICDDQTLQVWLYDHVWKVEPAMTEKDAKIGALLGIADMIASGSIGFVDQYFYSDAIAEAVIESGVKAFLAPSIFEGNPESKTIATSFQKSLNVYSRWNGQNNRLFIGFGPHAPYSVDKEFLEKIVDVAREKKTKIHTHLSETRTEVQEAEKNWNCTPIEYMDKLAALSLIYAAHCVHTTMNDQQLLAKYQTPVLSCPQSNLKLASGIAPIPTYLARKIPVCLGTDGSASNNNLDLLEEVRLVSLLHKGLNYNPTIIDMYTAYGLVTRQATCLFPPGVYAGMLKQGVPADLIVVNLKHHATIPIIHPLSNYIYAAGSSQIVLTLANGRILYENGKFLTLDIEQILEKAQRAIEGMIERSGYTLSAT